MTHFPKSILASLIITMSSIHAYPNDHISMFSIQKASEIPDPRNLSCDENCNSLEWIESDFFEEGYVTDDLNPINRHKTVNDLTVQALENPSSIYEFQNIGNHLYYPESKWGNYLNLSSQTAPEFTFFVNYPPSCIGNNSDLNTLTYEIRGNWALSSGYYLQAIQDFGKAIEIEPNNLNSYLGRGVAYFELGAYEKSIADYNTYVSQVKEPFSVTDFSVGFAKGLPKGIYDSGEGMLQFITDLACHPIQTGEKVYDSISILSNLAKSGEWNLIGEVLSPELHQLVSEWDSLSSVQKGELSGYAFGKHGADILLPGGAAKAIAKGTVAAKQLGTVCKNLQSAEKLLVLEALAEGNSAGINVGEAVVSANRTFTAAEELGLTTKEMAALKQSGELEQAIGKGRDFFAGNPELQLSYDLFKKAQENLRPYRKTFMPEQQVLDLIEQTGIQTLERPAGIPEHFKVRLSKKGIGIEYVDPQNSSITVRVMSGVPHSPNLCQQKPYVIHMKGGKAIDKNGKPVLAESPEAHVSFDEFIYKE